MLRLFLLLALLPLTIASEEGRILSRKRRYLTFPEGSAMTFLVCCNSVGPFAADLYTFGLDLDMSWDLPNTTRGIKPIYPLLQEQRRERRDVYSRLESLFEAAGLNGRTCVLRAMCEVSRRLGPIGETGGLIEELLKLVFTLPQVEGDEDDPRHGHYVVANKLGIGSQHECTRIFPGCPISLIDLVLGPEL
ncbi:uncharacterized protein LOC132205280 [Neocloeon triangulifer]|uniref:uncharacterized protein LOC132205280 n=1 Tax=Neocloeon triangulifer TaxID=2078957 RepID=UPI00286F54A2|nr:uncharacterized protein LOC132205280 [Neocloeon triangulifer]